MIKHHLKHSDVYDLALKVAKNIVDHIDDIYDSGSDLYPIRLAPIPRGGVAPAYLIADCLRSVYRKTAMVVSNFDACDVIIDDIYDSGKTAQTHNEKYNKPVFTLVDPTTYSNDAWIVFPWEEQNELKTLEDIPLRFLQAIGEDPQRNGLKDTPSRIVKSWKELYSGYGKEPKEVLSVQFDNDKGYDQMVILKDIEFYSNCEHHAQPFFGKAHIAYLPQKKIVGLSKLARLLDIFARRLQVQERLTQEVADSIMEHLKPLGCGVIIEATHFCMCSRGVSKQNSSMLTSSLKGVFLDNPTVRQEFLLLAGKSF